jgi:UDP-N-acetylmuramate dehydrogenase
VDASALQEWRSRISGKVEPGASMVPYTTFRVGGPADVLVEAETIEDLQAVADLRGDNALAIVGRGSNLLVSDEGFRGVALKLGRGFRSHERTEAGLQLGGAVYMPAAARLTARLGLEGLEFAAEIPASFGGAVAMNAGAHGREMADVLLWTRVVDLSTGHLRTLGTEDLSYEYRSSSVGPDEIVVSGEVSLNPGDPDQVAARIAEHLRWRRSSQPPGLSAGSVFKNPPGDSAGRIIDSCEAKGLRIGGARVSEVHANFIVADQGSTAKDVWQLVNHVRRLVADRTGVELEPEVRFLGDFPEPGADL